MKSLGVNDFINNNDGFLFSKKDLNFRCLEKWLDTPIFRILPIGRFFQILVEKKLTLVNPRVWDDPFENALLSSSFSGCSNNLIFQAKSAVYGQCWTLHRETDAMWRIYSPNKDGVRLRTTPRKLLSALKRGIDPNLDAKCFIGKVQYKSKSDLLQVFSGIDVLRGDGAGIAESLLYKRRAFLHEREVRLICSVGSVLVEDFLSFDVDFNVIFDRILFDPRMDSNLMRSYTSAVRGLGCKVEVKVSDLYMPPKDLRFKINR
ncbi:DUF2971 domain-containing protein [Alcaligenes faecalis]|uniref:DUF2971 domain-containing protein n=1 Tax=Alcaligenes faecalis TaxID=511 RepID=A0AAE9H8E3_ALCFA|nr:DUF2971 domain-containing protein [Alcaligenes faecalis]UPL22433.1 DUF2971 domain-containing protein [Alcaligenes faecalis]